MKIALRQIGYGSKTNSYAIMELHILSGNTKICEDVCNNNGLVDEQLIEELKELVNSLEENNKNKLTNHE